MVYHDNSSVGYIKSYATVDGIHFWYLTGKVLYYSEDGAQTWKIQDYNVDGTVIKLFDQSEGIILAKDAIWRTNDGGFSWRKKNLTIPAGARGFNRFHIFSQDNIWGWGQNVIVRLSK